MSSHTESRFKSTISAFYRSTKPQSSQGGLATQPSKPTGTDLEATQTSQHTVVSPVFGTRPFRPQTPPNQTPQDPATQIRRQPHTTPSQDSPVESPSVSPRSLLTSLTPRSLRRGFSRQTTSPHTTQHSRSQSESSKYTSLFSQIAVSVASNFEAARAARAAKRAHRQALRARRARELRERHFIKFIQKVRAGEDIKTDDDGTKKFVLTPDDYESLCLRIEQIEDDEDGELPSLSSFFQNELRYEYSPTENELTILMPYEIHDMFAGVFTRQLQSQLEKIADGIGQYNGISNSLKEAAAKIETQATTTLKFFGKGKTRKEPDAAYFYEGCIDICRKRLPSLVLEVNWSRHTARKLSERAKSLIDLSRGQIRTVITVDLHQIYQRTLGAKPRKELRCNDKGPAPATLTVWRLPLEDNEGENDPVEQVFRDEEGNAVDSFELQLSLRDFICERLAADLPGCDNVKITFASQDLCKMYEKTVKKHVTTQEDEAEELALVARGELPEMSFFKKKEVSRKSRRLAGKAPV